MLKFPNYTLCEEIYIGPKTIVFRALRESDNELVILKTVQAEYPSITEISQLRYEYQVSHNIDYSGIVKTHSLEIHKNNIGIVKEDFNAITLKEFSQTNEISISCFLEIAIQLTDILGHLHQLNIIHKDVNPSNILINVETNQVKITDFSIASRLQTESYQLSNYDLLEGTPAYISPEQTGRMNRSLDYRTDLYSLGVTFYEFLVGHLPFQTSDLLELIHHHISEYPLPPNSSTSNVPTAISDILMKLMAKNAEDRYQSALGLKADLEYCLNQLTLRDYIPNFSLGKLDHNSQFLIPQKLYGRATEVSNLLSTFERISSGEKELVLVCGYSGIGKTSIVNEVHKPILRKKGFFIRGKFDQLQRNIPYFAFLQGFKEFISHLLAESSEKIDIWREKLLSGLGNNGQIIINNIPELELIIGKQPQIPDLSPSENQNRFNQVFQSFIRVFSQINHPLVIFLDDLQWADLASLKLIERLVTNPDNHHLLLIGAYRDNEVDSIHPLTQMLEDLKSDKAILGHINVRPLEYNAVQQLINDTLHQNNRESNSLAELIFNKSTGNPFYVNQLLQTLYNEDLIKFNFKSNQWSWDIKEIQSVKIIDSSIVDLISIRLKKLPLATQKLLKNAACIGNKFSLSTLSVICRSRETDIASDLWVALQMGIILPLSDKYKLPLVLNQKNFEIDLSKSTDIEYQFLHDRVQQAAYTLIEENREKFHLDIGKLLLRETSKETLEARIFDVVNQMNIGANLLKKDSEVNDLSKLNYIAGKKAKKAAAYEASKQYFDICIQLLPNSTWEQQYNYTIEVYLLALESSYINVDYEKANNLLGTILKYAQNREDTIRAYELQIPYFFTQNQPKKAIDIALKILRILGIRIASKPSNIDILLSIIKVRLAQGLKSIEDFENLPTMEDVDKLAAMRVLMAVIPAAFVASPSLFPVAISKMVELSLRHGNAPISIFAYNSFGTLQCGALGNIPVGYRLSLLALKLFDEFNAQELKAKVLMVFNAINRPWKDHINQSIRMLPEGVQAGIEIGDIEYVGHCSAFYSIYLFLSGQPLDDVVTKQSQYSDLLEANKQYFQLTHTNIWRQVVANLLTSNTKPFHLEGEHFKESIQLNEILESKNELVIFPAFLAKSFLAYTFSFFEIALENSNLAHKYIGGVTGFIYVALHNFYCSLSHLAIIPHLSDQERRKRFKHVKLNQKKMRKWAYHCPENFLHKYQLIEAEIAKCFSQYQKAMNWYDLAIQSASKSGYIQEEAMANERAAEFYFGIGKEKVAQVYLTDAYYGYAKWGAIAKVRQLEEQYPTIFSRLQKSSQVICSIQTTESSSTTTGLIDLDLASVLKASQAISEEIILDQLLEKLMQVLMQSAGAQSIFLILERSNHFVIEASATKGSKSIRQSIPVATSKQVPCSIINYVARTLDPVFLGNAITSNFSSDPYILLNQIKSLLCLPMINQGHLMGMVYLENNLAYDAFRGDHLEVLRLLCAQAAISLENAYLYEDLQQSQAREQAEREINELKSRFISMTSHEFRTPLTAILGTTELIKHYGQGWETSKQHTYLDRIQKNVKHMTGLLDDVLVLSKADVGKVEFNPKPMNLEAFCSSLVEEFQLNTKHDQRIEFEVRGNKPNAYADEKILRQILSNLLSNAIKYSPENTNVRFHVNLDEKEATFFIQDQGIGIPEADQQHLFDSFHRATNVGQIQGTGLGLAIVKKSVELHRGTITFDSVADQGTTFIVKLSITEDAFGNEEI